MAIKKSTAAAPTAADLQRQRDGLAERLTLAEQLAADVDPVQWEQASKAHSDVVALTRAIAELDRRIAAARLGERDAAAAQREQERTERAAAARIRVDAAARAVCDAVIALDNGVLAELHAARLELGACGDMPSPAAAVALRMAGAVDAALAQWRVHAPTWCGLPTPPTAQELALAERQAAVALAQQRLERYRALRKNAKNNEPRPDDAMMRTIAGGLVGARRALLAMTEPALDEISVMNKCYAGVDELGEQFGGWHERRQDAARKAQREEAARAALLA